MLNKVTGLARAIAILLAIVGAFATNIPSIGLALLLLGVIAGFGYGTDDFGKLVFMALGLNLAGPAVTAIPVVGGYLMTIFAGVGTAVAGVLVTRIIIRLYELVVGDLKGLAG